MCQILKKKNGDVIPTKFRLTTNLHVFSNNKISTKKEIKGIQNVTIRIVIRI